MSLIGKLIEKLIGFPHLDAEATRRLALLESDDRLKRAMDSDVLSEAAVEQLSQFVHGRIDTVTFCGQEFRA